MNTDPNLRWDGYRWWRWNGQQWVVAEQAPQVPQPAAGAETTPANSSYGRADVDAAAAQMGWKLGAKRELRKLVGHLAEQERVSHLASGHYAGGTGVLVLTNSRLIFLTDGWARKTVEDFPMGQVASVRWASGLVHGTLTIFASGNESQFTHVPKVQGKALSDATRVKLSQLAPIPDQASPDPTAILRRLEQMRSQGLINNAEFDAKRADVLARM